MAEQNNKGKDQDLNKLQMVRREKLADLQAAGKDPFVITKYDVQQHSADVKEMYTAQSFWLVDRHLQLRTLKRQRREKF